MFIYIIPAAKNTYYTSGNNRPNKCSVMNQTYCQLILHEHLNLQACAKQWG